MKNNTQAFQYLIYICGFIGLLFLNNGNYCFAQHTKTTPPTITYVDTSTIPQIPITAKQNQPLPFSKSFQKVTVTPHFINYGTNDGLALSSVSCGITDSKGYLWFGTYGAGVSRFDGKTFTTFAQRQGLSDGIIRNIYEDNFSNIWLATPKGLNVYNGNSIKPILKLAEKNITHLAKRNNNSFWVTFSNNSIGIVTTAPEIDTKDSNCVQIIKLPNKDGKLKVRYVFQDSHNNLWLGTYHNGILFYNDGENISDTSNYINYTEKQLGNSFVQCITEDALGNVWIGTMTSLCRWDGKTIKKFNAINGQNETSTISLESDTKGDLWIGTTRGVAFCEKKYLSSEVPIFENYVTENGLSNNFIMNITEDSLKNIWFCTYAGGVSCYKRGSSSSIQLSHKSLIANVRTISESKKTEPFGLVGMIIFWRATMEKQQQIITIQHNQTTTQFGLL